MRIHFHSQHGWLRSIMAVVMTALFLTGSSNVVGLQTTPLLSVERVGFDATTNATLDFTLPSGFVLSGTVTGADGMPIFSGSVTARSGENSYGGTIAFSPFPLPPSSRYRVVLPAGTYTLSVTIMSFDPTSGATLIITHDISGTVAVAGNTTRDITVPPSPRTFVVQGKVTSAGSLPTDGAITFASDDGKIMATALSTDKYKIDVPPGNYNVSSLVFPSLPGDLTEHLNIRLTTATVSRDATLDLVLPTVVTLSGSIKDNTGAGIAPSTLLAMSADQLQPGSVWGTFASVSIPKENTNGQYTLLLPEGSFDLFAMSEIELGGGAEGDLTFPASALRLQVRGDMTQDFIRPAIGTIVTISGKVTDASGNPVTGATISAWSTDLTDTPDATLSASVKSGDDGRYSLKVLSGRQYTLACSPPSSS